MHRLHSSRGRSFLGYSLNLKPAERYRQTATICGQGEFRLPCKFHTRSTDSVNGKHSYRKSFKSQLRPKHESTFHPLGHNPVRHVSMRVTSHIQAVPHNSAAHCVSVQAHLSALLYLNCSYQNSHIILEFLGFISDFPGRFKTYFFNPLKYSHLNQELRC